MVACVSAEYTTVDGNGRQREARRMDESRGGQYQHTTECRCELYGESFNDSRPVRRIRSSHQFSHNSEANLLSGNWVFFEFQRNRYSGLIQDHPFETRDYVDIDGDKIEEDRGHEGPPKVKTVRSENRSSNVVHLTGKKIWALGCSLDIPVVYMQSPY